MSDLTNEADKLKSMGVMNQIPYRRLVKVMTILQLNIKDGCKMVPINPVGVNISVNIKFYVKQGYLKRILFDGKKKECSCDSHHCEELSHDNFNKKY